MLRTCIIFIFYSMFSNDIMNLKKLSFKIHAYYRYVDDTFVITPKNMI